MFKISKWGSDFSSATTIVVKYFLQTVTIMLWHQSTFFDFKHNKQNLYS